MQNSAISTRWFPTCEFSAKNAGLFDQVYTDFDHQAEQLVGHDQSYLQITQGAFQGRFLSGFLGPSVSIHMEHCNQALEQEVIGSPDHFSFGVVLSEGADFNVNGLRFGLDDVFVLPPKGSVRLLSPVGGSIMAVAIERDALFTQLMVAPNVAEWFDNLSDGVDFISFPRFAERLREDAVSALENNTMSEDLVVGDKIGQALIASIVAKLSLEWSGRRNPLACERPASYERFLQMRAYIAPQEQGHLDAGDISRAFQISQRSAENAFSEHANVGPLTYLRILRLHDVRRKLIDSNWDYLSIGDIASKHGFWDWSRFSGHYRRHFGEVPSVTRQIRSI